MTNDERSRCCDLTIGHDQQLTRFGGKSKPNAEFNTLSGMSRVGRGSTSFQAVGGDLRTPPSNKTLALHYAYASLFAPL